MKLIIGLVSIILLSLTSMYTSPQILSPKDNVYDILVSLDMEKTNHDINLNEKLIKQGEEIVKEGRTINPTTGKKTRFVSKHYSCTTCHNLEQEDPNLRISDPEARLPYIKAKGIPFLQGSTFKGIVNRESWYNDDYVKKYGDEKISKAHNSLRESIQLCAIECSQGRPMDNWEIESVLAYMWSLQYTLEDIDIDIKSLQESIDSQGKSAVIKKIKSHYMTYSPAHFLDSPADKKKGYEGLVGNPDNGKDLFELSCMWCHKPGSVSHFEMDPNKMDFKYLKRKIPKDSHFSLYQIIAYGTYALPGHRPYMPHYPGERISKQQVEDLRAYIEKMASKQKY